MAGSLWRFAMNFLLLLPINNGIILYKQTVQEGYVLKKNYTCDRFSMADFL